jgi:hypothetical protein
MPQWDNKIFDEHASSIVGGFFGSPGDATLTLRVTKVARAEDLSAEQVRRLCRAVNRHAFEHDFNGRKQAEDRVVDFDVANEEAVIEALHDDAKPAKTASVDLYPDLPDARKVAHLPEHPWSAAKTASAQESLAKLAGHLGEARPDRELVRLQKIADELGVQSCGAVQAWEQAMTGVHQATRGLYFDHDDFEKSAVALHGLDVLPELQSLRRELGLPALRLAEDKLAEVQDRIVATRTPETDRVKVAAEARERYHQITQARDDLAPRLADLRRRLGHG